MEKYLSTIELDSNLRELIRLRASQINGCAYCIQMHARRFYNGNVRDYRNLREAFPSNIIANMFDFEDRSFFDVEPSVRIAPDAPVTHGQIRP